VTEEDISRAKRKMRIFFLLRCLCLKILGPLFFAFTCFTLLSEIFKWRNTWNSLSTQHLSRHDAVFTTEGRFSFQIPPLIPNETRFVPGQFLKGVFPQNESYCHFSYGTPEHFNWTDKYMAFSPELGEMGPYRVIYNVIKVSDNEAGSSPVTKFGVTYCTHATPEFLYHVVEIVRRWDGPVSLAVYAPCTDAGLSLAIMHHMCHCLPEMSKLSIHLIFPITHPPVFTSTAFPSYYDSYSDMLLYPTFTNCSAPEALLGGKLKTFRQSEGLTYPVNLARNVARKASKTSYFLVSDVELLPRQDLVSAFISMLSRFRKQRVEGDGADFDLNPPLPVLQQSLMKNFVFVLPVFEVDEKESNVPGTKEELLELYTQNKAVYFHRWICLHCQRFPGLQRWLQRKPSAERAKVIQVLIVLLLAGQNAFAHEFAYL
jgi:N-acetyllactosaminide beta-1,3-N-acetylglucosaminyltransferase